METYRRERKHTANFRSHFFTKELSAALFFKVQEAGKLRFADWYADLHFRTRVGRLQRLQFN